MLHLIHPALVHFTVAFVLSGAAVEMWGILRKNDAAVRWGGSLLVLGLASLVPTIVAGYLAANTVRLPPGGAAELDWHELNGWVLLALVFSSQFWKAWCGGRLPEDQRTPYAVLLLVVIASTVYGAWLGGQMVYVQGIGVR